MKYKVGDKVKIREDLIVDNDYGSDGFTEEMEQYKGKTATITDIYWDKYDIDIDDGDWSWTDEMLEDCVDSADSALDEEKAKIVDVGFCLEYCGHRVIKNVYIDGYDDNDTLYCTDIEGTVIRKHSCNIVPVVPVAYNSQSFNTSLLYSTHSFNSCFRLSWATNAILFFIIIVFVFSTVLLTFQKFLHLNNYTR
jgi:hypothetical protein